MQALSCDRHARPDGRSTRRHGERGSILVLALLVTLVMLALGLTVMWIASTGSKVSSNVTRRQEALFAAESGLERARGALAVIANLNDACKGTMTGCTGVVGGVDRNRTRNDGGKVMCVPTATGVDQLVDVPLQAAGGGTVTYTVHVRNDEVEFGDGAILEDDRDRRVIIRSIGTARDRVTTVAVEALLFHNPKTGIEGYLGQAGGNAQNTNSAKGMLR